MRAHTTTLTTIDPAADLTDLEVLRSIVGDARVVAIGEGAHFVTEFSTIRQRLTRFWPSGAASLTSPSSTASPAPTCWMPG
jgi:erythromycin esterase-like protein